MGADIFLASLINTIMCEITGHVLPTFVVKLCVMDEGVDRGFHGFKCKHISDFSNRWIFKWVSEWLAIFILGKC